MESLAADCASDAQTEATRGGAWNATRASDARACELLLCHAMRRRGGAQDLNVLGIPSQGAAVAFDCLQVLAIGAVEEAVDVPADMRLDILLDAFAHQLVRLRFALEAVEDQPLLAGGTRSFGATA
eukprot:315521-Prymnesium_polylepis.1